MTKLLFLDIFPQKYNVTLDKKIYVQILSTPIFGKIKT